MSEIRYTTNWLRSQKFFPQPCRSLKILDNDSSFLTVTEHNSNYYCNRNSRNKSFSCSGKRSAIWDHLLGFWRSLHESYGAKTRKGWLISFWFHNEHVQGTVFAELHTALRGAALWAESEGMGSIVACGRQPKCCPVEHMRCAVHNSPAAVPCMYSLCLIL